METWIPLVLIALGGAAIVAGREGRTLVIAMVVQWLGLAWATYALGVGEATLTEATPTPAVVEASTALVCAVIFWLTLSAIDELVPGAVDELDKVQIERLKRAEARARRRRRGQPTPLDQLWPLVLVVAGGVGGYALARLYPIGESEAALLAFYWVTLSGVLALVIDGASEPVKLGVGLLALLNGAFLLVESLIPGMAGSVTILAIGSACRIGLAAIVAYSWGVLRASYNDLDLGPLFSARDAGADAELALVTKEEPPSDE